MRRFLLCSLALLGCSDDDDRDGGPNLDGGQLDARLPEDAARTPDAFTATDAAACTIEAQAAARVPAGATDCGTVPLGRYSVEEGRFVTDQALVLQVRECVLAAVASGEPFVALKQEQGIDSLVWTGFVRGAQGGPVTMLQSDSYGRNVVSAVDCTSLSEGMTNCQYDYRLCLTCATPSEVTTQLCGGP